MLMVETELRPSLIHGIGAFLLEDVKAGDLIWRFDSRIDRIFSNAELETMPERLQSFLAMYSTFHEQSGLWVLCGDNGRHFNHSDVPNTISQGVAFGDDIAASDLPQGTELTTNYFEICDAVRSRGSI
ncbi:MAG TPA: SET domain-containing protein [Sphingomicrobium sp.]|nr:SET domain-containing protein [Sphingomicrobium sp.]